MDWTPIIIAIVAGAPGLITGLMALRNQRREADATVVDKLTNSAQKIAETAWAEVERLKGQFDEYKCEAEARINRLEEEVKLQEIQIDNGHAQQLKTQLAYTIVCYQLRQLGYPPAVEPSELQSISIATLRQRAEIMRDKTDRQFSPKDTQPIK